MTDTEWSPWHCLTKYSVQILAVAGFLGSLNLGQGVAMQPT